MSLKGKVALVTGASRGIGKGIAIELGAAGATVYVTGRKPGQSVKLETSTTLSEVADEITKRGGKGIAVYVDHSDPNDVKKLFERIEKEQNGQLDVLVNNAYSAVQFNLRNSGKKFYEYEETPEEAWDIVNNVGLRNHFVCATYAAKLMVKRKSGLIVTIGSGGGIRYIFNVPYGVGKDAKDRLAADLAHELKGTGVVSVSLWPGAVKTEHIQEKVIASDRTDTISEAFRNGESLYFTGKTLAKLVTDPDLPKYNGQILLSYDLAVKYGVKDVDGRVVEPPQKEVYQHFTATMNKFRAGDLQQ
ncbi:unnamed protein product [Bursaphelenchus xylophilus]|uniref:(pine wood nematode) hypothetical protein n=1 Tax=Bursaphelenchus xylophilus TaxID=6326 RepID=A0A1I7RTE5_BURXY|nr:unnamed protein product [Bursaphelenchus xylophilus]CAG9122483.1 unnamed protein product [Bursaphelenchus xylophilus]